MLELEVEDDVPAATLAALGPLLPARDSHTRLAAASRASAASVTGGGC